MSRRGFTLLELVVSSAIAMGIAAMATQAFFQVQKLIRRNEALMALHQQAKVMYMALEGSLASAQQSCAVVVRSVRRAAPVAPAVDPGRVDLIFMRGNEQKDGYSARSDSGQSLNTSQIVWEEWTWKRGTECVHAGTNRPMAKNPKFDYPARWFRPGIAFRPSGAGGPNYLDKDFFNAPQPRRYLDPADPTGGPALSGPAVGRLDDNIWFPSAADPTVSAINYGTPANPIPEPEDIGDYTDLQRALQAPAFTQVSDLALQIVLHDETVLTVDDSADATIVLQGVWLDGRIGAGGRDATLAPPNDFPASDIAKRPKLLRARFTLTDRKASVSQSFAFSFAWPALAPSR